MIFVKVTTDVSEQLKADRKLVERIVKLFYWPAKMSVNPPADQEVLFVDEDESNSAISAADPLVESQEEAAAPPAESAGEGPVVPGPPGNLPSIMSVCTPGSAAVRTYSRKRPAAASAPRGLSLGISFKDLLDNQAKKMRLEESMKKPVPLPG